MYLPVDDKPDFDISQFFNKSNAFIEKNRKRGNVLVHCIYGISRSSTIIIAYLMRFKNSFDEAYKIIKQQRPKVNIIIK